LHVEKSEHNLMTQGELKAPLDVGTEVAIG
jgi:hypothetical protein